MIITIRPAVLNDYDGIIPLLNGFTNSELFTEKTQDSFKEILESVTNYMYVAEDGERIIGFVTFSIKNVLQYPNPILEVDELFVGIAYRKHGVGGKLMEQVEQDAKKLDVQNIYIRSSYKREGAHKFYEKIGYKNNGYYFKKAV